MVYSFENGDIILVLNNNMEIMCQKGTTSFIDKSLYMLKNMKFDKSKGIKYADIDGKRIW